MKPFSFTEINYNKTALSIQIEPRQVLSPKTFPDIMRLKLSNENTIFTTEDPYQNEIINGNFKFYMDEKRKISFHVSYLGNLNHQATDDPNEIVLSNGKKFLKATQNIYPKEFTTWFSGENNEPIKFDKKKKRPTKGTAK